MRKVIMDKDIDLSWLPEDTFVIDEQMGNCKVCGSYDDLRYGGCFDCAEYIMSNKEEAWDIRNPLNRWSVRQN